MSPGAAPPRASPDGPGAGRAAQRRVALPAARASPSSSSSRSLPLLHAGWLSLYDWDGLTVGKFVGLDNYSQALADPDVRTAFVHALQLIIFYSLLPVVLGLAADRRS